MATSGLAPKEFIDHESFTESIACSRCKGLMVVEQGFDSLNSAGPVDIPLRDVCNAGK